MPLQKILAPATTQEKEKNFPLRLPPDIYKNVQEVARRQHRSVNSLIVAVMEQYTNKELAQGHQATQAGPRVAELA